MPVLVNLFGTVKRVAWGMDREPARACASVGETLAFLRQPEPPGGFREALDMLPLARTVMSMRPKTVTTAPCQEVVLKGDDIDLGRLPIQTCWPGEPAPLITWPLVVTKGPGAKREDDYNLGIYRMQVTGPGHAPSCAGWPTAAAPSTTAAGRRGQARAAARLRRAWAPIPGTILAAVTPVPDTLSEYQFAGLLRGRKVELVDCKTDPAEGPRPGRDRHRGPGPPGRIRRRGALRRPHRLLQFGRAVPGLPGHRDHDAARPDLPVHLHRPPAGRASVLGEALNEVFIPLLSQQFPEIVDFWLPPEGCSYRIAVVSMKKAYPGHAKRVMMGVWSYLRQFMYTKWVIVVDDDINARDWKDVMWAISTRMDPARDITVIENTPIDYLDFASPESGLGSKIGLDATNKWPPETKREWGQQLRMDEDVVREVTRKWDSYGIPLQRQADLEVRWEQANL